MGYYYVFINNYNKNHISLTFSFYTYSRYYYYE